MVTVVVVLVSGAEPGPMRGQTALPPRCTTVPSQIQPEGGGEEARRRGGEEVERRGRKDTWTISRCSLYMWELCMCRYKIRYSRPSCVMMEIAVQI